MAQKVNVAQIQKAIHKSIPLTVKTYTLPHETEEYISDILGLFLKELGQERLKDRLAYCLREIAVNAKKANTKRVYFEEMKLDINDEQDYEAGMKNFKDVTMDNINYYLEKQKEKGLYIKVVFHIRGNNLTITVKNNVEITRREQLRIYDRIARSRVFSSLEEALGAVMDSTEGAGLGIVILILMIKKIGLSEDAFDIDVENGETIAQITIPMSDIHLDNLDALTHEIVNEIDVLPQFPESIVYLQKLISDPDSEISDIARQISTDPSLTADLLKLVNSAQFMMPKKVDNIAEAVKIVGLKGLKNLLYSYGTQKLLKNATKVDQKELWQHSYQTAYYAYNLSRSFKRKKDLVDDAYVGGILHDMGKIVFSVVHPQLEDKIKDFCARREISGQLLEDLSAGLNQAEIGAKMAEKWNFPEQLIGAIRYHHQPSEAPDDVREIVEVVYLANALCEYGIGNWKYEQLDMEVLYEFNIKSEEQLRTITEKLEKGFEKELEKASDLFF